MKECCCEMSQTPPNMRHMHGCTPGRSAAVSKVYDPNTHICCGGHVSKKQPGINQCCGVRPYVLADHRVLCCNNILYTGREDGERCSVDGKPYHPAKGTMCSSAFHKSAGIHCCGKGFYNPDSEICCNGHRRPKAENTHCCGVEAYSISDPQMRCCAGKLYNLTNLGRVGGQVQCCGSILMSNPLGDTLGLSKDECCSSQDQALLYSAQPGFSCCGHLHYNTSLSSCWAGRLCPARSPRPTESRLLSVGNLNTTKLCHQLRIGTLESMSVEKNKGVIVFRNVLDIYGRNGTVIPLASPHVLQVPDHCSWPELIPGHTYFWDFANFFVDFNHPSPLQSLHFILLRCRLS
ncbi:galaxin-2 [Centroberyx affinis]|uniref:galaxin-2 n=1 Tax=Centroberyx affinis TaxID=166261 RepID=UPI003A5C379E